jgi:hypothetical protein
VTVRGRTSLILTDQALVGHVRPSDASELARLAGRWESGALDAIRQTETVLVIERDRTGAREFVRRLLTDAGPCLLRERADYWIERAPPRRPQGSAPHPNRTADFTLEAQDRVAHVLCLPPGAGAGIDDVLSRLAAIVAQIDGRAVPFVEQTERGSAPVTVQRFLFRCGSSAALPHANDVDFLDTLSMDVRPAGRRTFS